MLTSDIGGTIDSEAARATVASQEISDAGSSAKTLLPRAILDLLGPYSAAQYIAERVVESELFNALPGRGEHLVNHAGLLR